MNVRKIKEHEISKYESIGVPKEGTSTLNLKNWLDQKRTKLEWCFVAEENGTFLARIIYGVFDEQPLDLKIWQFKLDKQSYKYNQIGEKLIQKSLMILSDKSLKTVEYHLYSNINDDFVSYQEIFKTCGFQLSQQKNSYKINSNQLRVLDQRLNYKTLNDVGEKQFLDAIENVTMNTLDRDDIESVSVNGSKEAARLYFELLKEMDFNDTWWRLAYESNGDFVGLVVPQRINEIKGVVNYIGVVPSKRGKGYVKDLIEEASRIMIEANLQVLMADVDVENYPLFDALINLGYTHSRSLAVLKRQFDNA